MLNVHLKQLHLTFFRLLDLFRMMYLNLKQLYRILWRFFLFFIFHLSLYLSLQMFELDKNIWQCCENIFWVESESWIEGSSYDSSRWALNKYVPLPMFSFLLISEIDSCSTSMHCIISLYFGLTLQRFNGVYCCILIYVE